LAILSIKSILKEGQILKTGGSGRTNNNMVMQRNAKGSASADEAS
jgi:hypothetical protein